MVKIKKAGLLMACTALFMSCSNKPAKEVDITNFKCTVTTNRTDMPVGEGINELIDNDYYSKFLTFGHSAEIMLAPIKRCQVSGYTLVSGNDEPDRDPVNWLVEASHDNKTWVQIDKQENVQFSGRNQKLDFHLLTSDVYGYYRFKLNTNGHEILQVSEIELRGSWDADDKRPIARFSANNTAFFDKGQVKFENLSEQAGAYQWFFKGGTPESSTESNPLVTYNDQGRFPVKLIVKNKHYTDTASFDDFVIVKRYGGWEQFCYPKINFVNTTLGGNGDLYQELVPKPLELINKVSLDVCKMLYRSIDEIDILEVLDYSIEDIETISAKGGNPPHINIFFSSSYLKNKKGIMSDEELIAEITGVLYHELAHGYQYSPKGAGAYAQGTDFFGFLEGIADYVRLNAGYSSYKYRKVGGHWNDGYKTTAFFIDWLQSKDEDFVYKLNQSAKTYIPWSWDKACQDILSSPVQDLWNEYQDYLIKNQN